MCVLVKEREERERETQLRCNLRPDGKRSKRRKKNGIKANRAESLKTSLKDKVLTRLESIYSLPPFTGRERGSVGA